jgi:gas vesicle protein GvpL/GvpF
VIELYAITDHPGPPLPDVAPLRLVAADGLAAVCAPAGDGAWSPEALWRHEAVVEALMEGRDLLPVRFGTRLADDAAAQEVVERRHDDFAQALARIRGAVELSVRALLVGQEAPARFSEDPAEYLKARARVAAAADEVVRIVHDPLSELARASRRRTPGGVPEVLRGAYLVDRERVDDFARDVGRLQQDHPELRLLCTGPWPPYSFVDA